MPKDKVKNKVRFDVTSEDIVSVEGTSLGDYYPSGSAIPRDYDFGFGEYKTFLLDEKTREESKIPIKKDEVEKIAKIKTKTECVRYILKNKTLYSKWETILVVCDNILKVLPTVIFSSLPILIFTSIKEISYTTIFCIYLTMGLIAIICGIVRIQSRKILFALTEYHNFANKRREELPQ